MRIARRPEAETELFDLLAEKIREFSGDFDEWLRDGDEENIGLAHELVVSAYFPPWRNVTRSDIEGQLEASWDGVKKDLLDDYQELKSLVAAGEFSPRVLRNGP